MGMARNMMSGLCVMILSRWVRIVRFRSMMTLGMIAWFRIVVSRVRVDRVDWVGRVGWWASITLPTFAINSSRMVTGSEIFIENCSVATVKGVLFSISMTIVVNLASGLRISIMTAGIGYFTAIKSCVRVMGRNSDRFDLFRLIGSFFEHYRSLRFIGVGGSIPIRGWGSIGWLRLVVSRCGGMIWFWLMI